MVEVVLVDAGDTELSRLTEPRTRWFVLAALWVVLLVLGIGGFLQQASDGDTELSSTTCTSRCSSQHSTTAGATRH